MVARSGGTVHLLRSHPSQREDGKPVHKYKCIKLGRIIGDCSSLEGTGDRQNITLEQEF